ncbi:MAG: hypothetical protein WCE82_07770 [Halobacteriota archaeon]
MMRSTSLYYGRRKNQSFTAPRIVIEGRANNVVHIALSRVKEDPPETIFAVKLKASPGPP